MTGKITETQEEDRKTAKDVKDEIRRRDEARQAREKHSKKDEMKYEARN